MTKKLCQYNKANDLNEYNYWVLKYVTDTQFANIKWF